MMLLPAPDIGRRCGDEMRGARAAGFECGVHTWDHVVWQDHVRHRDAAWTRRAMDQSWQRYADIFGEPPATHGAAGWQMNEHAFRELDARGLRSRTQDMPPAVYVAGNLYLVRTAVLESGVGFFPPRTFGVVCDAPFETVDIDTEADWIVAEALGRHYGRTP